MNYKQNGILLAKAQFAKDLQGDADYIEYRQRCEYIFRESEYRICTASFGVVNAANNRYVLDSIGDTCESIVSDYLNTCFKK